MWDDLAHCSEIDTGLAGSLVCDAWDLLSLSGPDRAIRSMFEDALADAIAAYNAAPLSYRFNPRTRQERA